MGYSPWDHKKSDMTEGGGKTESTGSPRRNVSKQQVLSSTFLLCAGALFPGSGTEGLVCTDRQG